MWLKAWRSTLLVCLLALMLAPYSNAWGQEASAQVFIAAQQDTITGQIHLETDLGSPNQSTLESAKALSGSLNQHYSTQADAAVDSVALQDLENTPTEIIAKLALLKRARGDSITTERTAIAERANLDGGYGDFPGFGSSALTTAFVLPLMDGSQAEDPVSYLLSSQNPSGGWQLSQANTASVEVTAQAILALWGHRNNYPVAAHLNAGLGFLKNNKDAQTQLWSTTEQSLLVLQAAATVATDRTEIDVSLGAINALQSANGSIENDVYLTALFARLQQILANPPADQISVTGRVIDGDTGFSLYGASVVLEGTEIAQTVTSASGVFSFEGLPEGNYSLTVESNGYGPLTSELSLATGDQIDLGVLPLLTSGSSLGHLLLSVSSSTTNLPVAGAQITIDGFDYTTDALGQLQVNNAPPGNLDLQISAPGFLTNSLTVNIVAGQTLRMLAELTPISEAQISVAGVIVAADSGTPLVGVDVAIDNSGQVFQAQTDTDGSYEISGLLPGPLAITAALSGYEPVTTALNVDENTSVIFSPRLVLTGEAQPPSVNSGIIGSILDTQSGLPVEGADVMLSVAGGSENIITDAAGLFAYSNLSAGTFNVVVSKAGYDQLTFSIDLPIDTIVELNSLRLVPVGFEPSINISGTVVDSTTNELLANIPVELETATGILSTVSEADGRFMFEQVSGDEAVLAIAHQNYNAVEYSLPLISEQNLGMGQIRLRPIDVEALFVDLKPGPLNDSGIDTNLQSLEVEGTLRAVLNNVGNIDATVPFKITAFLDNNGNQQFDASDPVLGVSQVESVIPAGDATNANIPVYGNLAFRDQSISVWVDSGQVVIEVDETNNTAQTADACTITGRCSNQVPLTEPVVKWDWIPPSGVREDVYGPVSVAQLTDDNQDGQIDEVDDPDIVFISRTQGGGVPGKLNAVNGADGTQIWQSTDASLLTDSGSTAVADIDGDGIVEILASSRRREHLYAFEHTGELKWAAAAGPILPNSQVASDGIAIADLNGDSQPEIILGRRVYSANGVLIWAGTASLGDNDGYGVLPVVADINLDGVPEVIAGSTVYRSDGSLLWKGSTIGESGFAGIGNFDEDSFAEIVVVESGRVYLFNHDGEVEWGPISIPGGGSGGAPTIADIDGDGEPEIGVAGRGNYVALETDGSIKWTSITQDFSSGRTGSSVFDLNSDGASEILYADEEHFRIYDGETGETLYEIQNVSGTALEYPVVADIDSDGHAEILVGATTWRDSVGPEAPGLRAYEAIDDSWAATRSIWNQHTYSINNINDDGSVPESPVESWLTHNTFRLNAFPECSAADPVIKWEWPQPSTASGYTHVAVTPIVAQTNDDNLDGVVDEKDVPDIIFNAYSPVGLFNLEEGRLRVISGVDGSDLWVAPQRVSGTIPPSVADIDGDGYIEIIIGGRSGVGLFAFEHDGTLKWQNTQVVDGRAGSAAIADLDRDGVPEIVYGARVLDPQGNVKWSMRNGYDDKLPLVVDLDGVGDMEIVSADRAFDSAGNLLWDLALPKNPDNRVWGRGVWPAVGNLDEDLDPEIVMVVFRGLSRGGDLYVVEHDGAIKFGPVLMPTIGGGPPTLGDFDGDGETEIGVAGSSAYVVFETDGSVKWEAPTKDFSSARTGSSAFDFDDDGEVEILYADEEYFRVYRGATGEELYKIENSSRTAYEYPVVVDIDNDNRAEVIIAANSDAFGANNGIRVFEAANDSWANTRSIWNQHTYHINNINDDGTIPVNEDPSWLTHNTYRLNTFLGRSASALPDLTLSQLRLTDLGGGNNFVLSARIGNGGAIFSDQPVKLTFYLRNENGADEVLAEQSLQEFAAGEYRDVTASVQAQIAAGQTIYAKVDSGEVLEECDESNNQMSITAGDILGTVQPSTDKTVYSSNEPVYISNLVQNTGSYTNSYRLAVALEDADGVRAQQFPEVQIDDLGAAAQQTLALDWNTLTHIAGEYRVVAQLISLDDELLDTGYALITIAVDPQSELVSLRTATDKLLYHVDDSVQLDNLVGSQISNTVISGASLLLTVSDSAGTAVFSTTHALSDITQSSSTSYFDVMLLSDAVIGEYLVTGIILDSTGTPLAQDFASFTVTNSIALSLEGSVTVNATSVFQGDELACDETLTNSAAVASGEFTVRSILLNLDQGSLLAERPQNLSLAGGASASFTNVYDSQLLAVGQYACALQLLVDDEWQPLDVDYFEVQELPVKMSLSSVSLAPRGAVLVLMDAADNGHTRLEPDAALQREFLEDLLTSHGWQYTITTNAEDFLFELRTGRYSNYLLLSEQEELSEQGQKELREAVYRGEGLVEAGSHDQRQGRIDDALGIKFRGQSNRAHGIHIFDSDLGAAEITTLSIPESVLTGELNGAETVGEFVPDMAKGNKPAPPAATTYTFGNGRSVYIGVDVLAEATLQGTRNNLFARLILEGLSYVSYVNSADSLNLPGRLVRVDISMFNEQQASPARLTVSVPSSLQVVSAEGAQVTADALIWSLDLAEQQTQVVSFAAGVPQVAAELDVRLESGVDRDFIEQDVQTFTLAPASVLSLDQVIAELPASKDYKQVRQALDRARQHQAVVDWAGVLRELLKASDHLADFDSPTAQLLRTEISNQIRATEQRMIAP